MGKYIKKVEDVLQKAVNKGSAKSGPYYAEYNGVLRLFHYGTLIFSCQNNQIVELGGYSRSDADAIYTAMRFCGINADVSNAKKYQGKGYKVINGWYII